MNAWRRAVDRLHRLRRGPPAGAPRSDVFRNMLVLAAGTGGAKVIGFLGIALVTRLYTPQQFGLFSLFLSAVALASPFSTLRYAAALPLPRGAAAGVNLLAGCLLLLVASCVVVTALLAAFAPMLFERLSAPELATVWPLLVLTIAAAGCHEVLSTWAVRGKRFKTMATAEVGQSLLGSGLKIGLAWVGWQRVGLLLGHVAGLVLICLILAVDLRPTLARWRSQVRPGRIGAVLRRHASFPLLRMPSHVLLMFSMQAPMLFVSALYGIATAGQLGLAMSTLLVPLLLVGQPTSQAYLAEIARIGRHDAPRIRAISREVAGRMLLLGAVPTLALLFAAPRLFGWVFGAPWTLAGEFASALAIYLLAWFVAYPLTHALSVFGRNDLLLRFNAVRAAMTVLCFVASHRLGLSALAAMHVYGVAMALYYVLNLVAIFGVMKGRAGPTPR